MERGNQSGISLLLVVMIMAIMLSAVFGLSFLLNTQFKMLSSAGNSVIAFYAADTGAERVLKTIIKDKILPPTGTDGQGNFISGADFTNGASYRVNITCTSAPLYPDDCIGLTSDANCLASQFCIRSVGSYQGVNRAVEINL